MVQIIGDRLQRESYPKITDLSRARQGAAIQGTASSGIRV